MTPWNDRSDTERQRLATAFSALHDADTWLESSTEARAGDWTVPMPALFAAATDPRAALPAMLAARLATDPALRADFDALIDRVARCRIPRAAAASSGGLDRREAAGFTIRLKPSRADDRQLYVLIDLPAHGAGTAPEVMIVKGGASGLLKQALPNPDDGTIRLLVSADGALAVALRDPSTAIDLI